jgi:hypothetical protein
MSELSEAFVTVVDLVEQKHDGPLNGEVWTYEWDVWRVTLNGASNEQQSVPGFHCAVERKGLPVAMLSPYSGVFIGTYEDAFIDAAKAELRRLKGVSA